MKRTSLAALAAALMLAAPAAAQPPLAAGTYAVDGGSYAIDVRPEGETLVVIEPNKRSVYQRQADGSFHFTNPVNGILYGLRVIDGITVEAFKPGTSNPPTRLSRVGGAPAVQAVNLPPSSAAPDVGAVAVPPAPAQDDLGALARSYQERARSDPANVQAWTVCAAVAQKRSTANPAEAEAFARQSATVLQLIATDPARSPCPDAIPQSLWAGGEAEPVPAPPTPEQIEAARLRELNLAADARAKADAERRAADRAAYDAQVAAAEAAKAQFAREQAAYQEARARSDAAAADYARQMEAYRRSGGKPQ